MSGILKNRAWPAALAALAALLFQLVGAPALAAGRLASDRPEAAPNASANVSANTAANTSANASANVAPTASPPRLRAQIRRWNQAGFDAYERGDVQRAVAAYGRAARAGDASGRYNLAVIRLRDESRRPPLARALVLLRSSAQAGFAPAQYMLASLHENGESHQKPLQSLLLVLRHACAILLPNEGVFCAHFLPYE